MSGRVVVCEKRHVSLWLSSALEMVLNWFAMAEWETWLGSKSLCLLLFGFRAFNYYGLFASFRGNAVQECPEIIHTYVPGNRGTRCCM